MYLVFYVFEIIWNIKVVMEWKYYLIVIIIIWIVFEIIGFVGGRNFYYMYVIVFFVVNM